MKILNRRDFPSANYPETHRFPLPLIYLHDLNDNADDISLLRFDQHFSLRDIAAMIQLMEAVLIIIAMLPNTAVLGHSQRNNSCCPQGQETALGG